MGKMKLGHDHRQAKLPGVLESKNTGLSMNSFLAAEKIKLSDFEEIAEKVMKRHADAFTKLAVNDSCQCSPAVPVVLEQKVVERTETRVVSTLDKRARQHSQGVRASLEATINRKHQLVNKALELSRQKCLELDNKVVELQARKPQEIHTVTEKSITVEKTHKLVIAGLVLSVALNILILIIK
jgi:hypothetical protein